MFKVRKNKTGVRSCPPPSNSNIEMKSFLLSVKPVFIAEEKVRALGLEPVGQFLPSARFKSGINLVQDTAE